MVYQTGKDNAIKTATQDRVALITGGARRIGAGIVKALHAARYRVVVHCHQSEAEARSLVYALNQIRPNSAFVCVYDLAKPEAASELMAETLTLTGRLDALINNASVFYKTDLQEFDEAAWRSLFHINVQVPFELSLQARPHLAKHAGAIINLTDIHANVPMREYAVYCQTKAALAMQTKALAVEFAPDVRVNAIAPGVMAWPEGDNSLTDEVKKMVIRETPLKRLGDPIFIADMVVAVLQNAFITGQIVAVDGGRSIKG